MITDIVNRIHRGRERFFAIPQWLSAAARSRRNVAGPAASRQASRMDFTKAFCSSVYIGSPQR